MEVYIKDQSIVVEDPEDHIAAWRKYVDVCTLFGVGAGHVTIELQGIVMQEHRPLPIPEFDHAWSVHMTATSLELRLNNGKHVKVWLTSMCTVRFTVTKHNRYGEFHGNVQ